MEKPRGQEATHLARYGLTAGDVQKVVASGLDASPRHSKVEHLLSKCPEQLSDGYEGTPI
jgi:hypothetical protein